MLTFCDTQLFAGPVFQTECAFGTIGNKASMLSLDEQSARQNARTSCQMASTGQDIRKLLTRCPSDPSLDLSSPVYLLIQPNTSLCQTNEFSGFSTHCHTKQVSDVPNHPVA